MLSVVQEWVQEEKLAQTEVKELEEYLGTKFADLKKTYTYFASQGNSGTSARARVCTALLHASTLLPSIHLQQTEGRLGLLCSS